MDRERDADQVPREVIEEALDSDVFIVGQALAQKTQRLSGRPYVRESGELSETGEILDGFLRRFDYTIRRDPALPMVYSTDLVQRWPGPAPSGEGDRAPNAAERENCALWFEAELVMVQPRVVLLLGGKAANRFFRRYRGSARYTWGQGESMNVAGRAVAAFPVHHPAYRRRKPQLVDAVYAEAATGIRTVLRSRPDMSDGPN